MFNTNSPRSLLQVVLLCSLLTHGELAYWKNGLSTSTRRQYMDGSGPGPYHGQELTRPRHPCRPPGVCQLSCMGAPRVFGTCSAPGHVCCEPLPINHDEITKPFQSTVNPGPNELCSKMPVGFCHKSCDATNERIVTQADALCAWNFVCCHVTSETAVKSREISKTCPIDEAFCYDWCPPELTFKEYCPRGGVCCSLEYKMMSQRARCPVQMGSYCTGDCPSYRLLLDYECNSDTVCCQGGGMLKRSMEGRAPSAVRPRRRFTRSGTRLKGRTLASKANVLSDDFLREFHNSRPNQRKPRNRNPQAKPKATNVFSDAFLSDFHKGSPYQANQNKKRGNAMKHLERVKAVQQELISDIKDQLEEVASNEGAESEENDYSTNRPELDDGQNDYPTNVPENDDEGDDYPTNVPENDEDDEDDEDDDYPTNVPENDEDDEDDDYPTNVPEDDYELDDYSMKSPRNNKVNDFSLDVPKGDEVENDYSNKSPVNDVQGNDYPPTLPMNDYGQTAYSNYQPPNDYKDGFSTNQPQYNLYEQDYFIEDPQINYVDSYFRMFQPQPTYQQPQYSIYQPIFNRLQSNFLRRDQLKGTVSKPAKRNTLSKVLRKNSLTRSDSGGGISKPKLRQAAPTFPNFPTQINPDLNNLPYQNHIQRLILNRYLPQRMPNAYSTGGQFPSVPQWNPLSQSGPELTSPFYNQGIQSDRSSFPITTGYNPLIGQNQGNLGGGMSNAPITEPGAFPEANGMWQQWQQNPWVRQFYVPYMSNHYTVRSDSVPHRSPGKPPGRPSGRPSGRPTTDLLRSSSNPGSKSNLRANANNIRLDRTQSGPQKYKIYKQRFKQNVFSTQGPQRNAFPKQRPQQNTFPKQEPQQNAFPKQEPQQNAFPKQRPQQNTFPNQGPQQNTFPNQGPQQNTFPNQGPQQNTFPNQGPRQNTFPNQGPQQNTFPNQGPQQNTFPNQGPQQNTFPNQGPQQNTFPNQGPRQNTFPNQGPQQNTFPWQEPQQTPISSPERQIQFFSPFSNQFPQQNPYSNRFPQQNPYSNQFPQQNPYSNQFPQQNPYSTQFSQQNPYSTQFSQQNPYSTQFSQQNPYSTQFSQQNPYSTLFPQQNPYSNQIPQPNTFSNPFARQDLYSKQFSQQSPFYMQNPNMNAMENVAPPYLYSNPAFPTSNMNGMWNPSSLQTMPHYSMLHKRYGGPTTGGVGLQRNGGGEERKAELENTPSA